MANQKASEQKDGFSKRGKYWSYRFRVPDPATGKTKEVRISGFPTKEEAKADRIKRQAEAQNGKFVRSSKETVGEFFPDWLEKKIAKGDIKPTTAHQYRQAINYYLNPHLGVLKLNELNPELLENFLITLIQGGKKNGAGLSHATVRMVSIVISQGLDQAVTHKKIASNPMKEVQKPKGKTKEVTTYSSSEIKALLALAESHRLYALFYLACKTGARRGELLALRWSDFDPEAKTISISKSRGMAGGEIIEQPSTKSKSGNRKVQLSSSVVTVLQDHAKKQSDEMVKVGSGWVDTGYIFVQENGEPLYPTTPYLIFRKFIKELGFKPEPFHALRHSHVTELLRAKMPVHMVAKRIGDEVATVMKVYAHSNAEDDQVLADTYEQVLENA